MAKKYDLGYYSLGNGVTVGNRANNFKNLAHISDEGKITYYVSNLPKSVKDKIKSQRDKLKKNRNTLKAVGNDVVAINWKDGTSTKRNSKGKLVTKKSTARDKKLGTMQKMNDFMKAKEKARKANKASFSYNGKTYKRAKTKTGMVIYKRTR